ncbi:MAG: CBS domain-containing protein [Planctomycetota bacterium]
MMTNVVAREMMVSNLITLSPSMDVLDAIDVLLRHRISGAPVVDHDDHFVGIFSERSCMEFMVGSMYEGLPPGNLMSFVDTNPTVIHEETDLLTIAQTFLNAACRRLPVIDDRGRLRGQISRRDIMRAYRDYVSSVDPVPVGAGLYLSAIIDVDDRPI